MGLGSQFARIMEEPPFRLLAKAFYGVFPQSVAKRQRWDISARPNYLMGVLAAAEEARRTGVPAISVFEFGVAGGNGLIALQEEAEAVERATGIQIKVFGFDNGAGGLPDFIGDYRDHPDAWQPGDYPMDEAKLRARLAPRTTLILGNVRDTVPAFVEAGDAPPVGFISIDVDLYSSTRQALQILSLPKRNTLMRVYMYFDDIDLPIAHAFAGELLAIDEFNRENDLMKIDKMRGLHDRPFPEKQYLRMMYVAHDLAAISRVVPEEGRTPLMTHVMR